MALETDRAFGRAASASKATIATCYRMKATYLRRAAKDTFFAIRSNRGRSSVCFLIPESGGYAYGKRIGFLDWFGGSWRAGNWHAFGHEYSWNGQCFRLASNRQSGLWRAARGWNTIRDCGPGAGYCSAIVWWGAPTGWTDLDLYDYNNNRMLDDNEIADIVADNIHLDPFIPLSDERNLSIEVRNGVVTLSGTVRNPRVKPLAYADAFWSPGVVDVIDNIQVQPMQRRAGDRQQGQQALPQEGQLQAASQQGQPQAASQGQQQAVPQQEQQPARRTVGR